MKLSVLPILLASLISYVPDTRALTLEALFRNAMEKNPHIQKAKCDVEQASGRRLVFRAVALPNAIIGIAGGVQGGYRHGEKETQPFGFAYGAFTQPLFNAAIPASRRRGDVEVLIAQQELNVAVIQQLHTARIAFYTALYNRSLKQLREKQRDRLEENAGSQKSRYESGLVDRSTLVGATVQTRELDPRIEAAQRAYEGARLKLAEAMGADLGAHAEMPTPEDELHYKSVQIDLEEGTVAALQNRPDLKLARLLVRAADEDQRMIEAAYYPAINAAVAGEYIPVSGVRRESEGSPRRSDDVISPEVRAGAAYSWRVIDNGRVSGAAAKQGAVRQANELTLRKLETDVPRDLARIRNELEAIARKETSLANASSSAEQAATTVQENLAAGVVSQLEFRLAENALLDIKSALLGLAYQQQVALAEWDRARGLYFQFLDDSARSVQ